MRKSFWRALFLTLLVGALNVGLWGFLNRPVHIADWHGDVGGFAFNPFQRYQDPIRQIYPSESELDSDIRLLTRYTKRLRTYSSVENPQIPRIAKFYGARLMAGAWIEGRAERNENELAALIALARKYDNIDRAIVGNEAILRGDLSVRSLIHYLDRARAQLDIPVSTAEPLDTWQRNPELADHVDFITVHILPYWEFIDRKDAIGFVLGQYRELQRMFPDKPIVIGEVGWPSNGNRRKYALPSLANEAHFLRDWFNVAARENIDYYVMEAIDQPWKETLAGRVEAYWGVFDASRSPKFSFSGTVISKSNQGQLLKGSKTLVLACFWILFARAKSTRGLACA